MNSLNQLITSILYSDKLFLLGDFNARVGTDYVAWHKVRGQNGMGKENTNGSLLLTLCTKKQLVINTVSKEIQFQDNMATGHWH